MDRLSSSQSPVACRSSDKENNGWAVHNGAGQSGFTLLELMITLAVAAILLAVATPSLRTFVQNSKINSTADSFLTAIQQARSEAITRGNWVLLCRTADPTGTTCGDSDTKDWSPGWLMYAAPGASSEVPYNSSNHVLIKRGSAAADGVEITADADGNTYLTFGPDGTLREPLGNGDAQVLYAVCDERGPAEGKLIVLHRIGRPYMTDDFADAPDCAPNN